MNALLQIGVDPKSIYAARDSILDILNVGRGDQVTITALESFNSVTKVSNVTVRDCKFFGGQPDKDGNSFEGNSVSENDPEVMK